MDKVLVGTVGLTGISSSVGDPLPSSVGDPLPSSVGDPLSSSVGDMLSSYSSASCNDFFLPSLGEPWGEVWGEG